LFTIIFTSCVTAQSSCGGFEYSVDEQKDIPTDFVLYKTYRVDGYDKKEVVYTLILKEKSSVYIALRNPCDNEGMVARAETIDGTLIMTNTENSSDSILFEAKEKSVIKLKFSFKGGKCRNCGVAIVSLKDL
jgi:hypothetical protein